MNRLPPTLRLVFCAAFAVLFFLAAIVYLPHAAGITAVLAVVLLFPIPAWQRWLKRILRGAKPILVTAVAVCVFLLSPRPNTVSPSPTPSAPKRTTVSSTVATTTTTAEEKAEYILNLSSKKFHLPHCANAKTIKEKNRDTFTGTTRELKEKGYSPCGNCLG